MLTTISNSIIPMVIFAVVLYGCIKKTNVYEDFIDGAFDGMKIVVELVPTLIGLFPPALCPARMIFAGSTPSFSAWSNA